MIIGRSPVRWRPTNPPQSYEYLLASIDHEIQMRDPLMAEPDVLKATTLGRTKLRELLRAGNFPPPVQVSTCRVAWTSSSVQTWIDQLPIADAYQNVDKESL